MSLSGPYEERGHYWVATGFFSFSGGMRALEEFWGSVSPTHLLSALLLGAVMVKGPPPGTFWTWALGQPPVQHSPFIPWVWRWGQSLYLLLPVTASWKEGVVLSVFSRVCL